MLTFAAELVVKNSPANGGELTDAGSIPGSGRFPGGESGNPLQYSCLENSMDKEEPGGYRLWGCKESDMTEHARTYSHLKSRGKKMKQTLTMFCLTQHI